MAVSPLTKAQQEAVDALVAARRLDRVAPDPARAAAFLAAASERISQLPLLTSVVVAYDLAYDAVHDVGEALPSRAVSAREQLRCSLLCRAGA